jgi:ribonucleotide monophosphatase NagD (HAD superfamily)
MNCASINDLFERHQVFLIDAYGVLVTSSGPLPGARDFIERLKLEKREYFILTNDASRLPESSASFYASCGIDIPVERIISAGMAIGDAFSKHNLFTPRAAVLGTEDSHEIVRRAGARLSPVTSSGEYDAVIIADDSGFDLLPSINDLLSSIYRQVTRTGQAPLMLLPNADLLYPRGPDEFGFTSGSIGRLIELGLDRVLPDHRLRFKTLGKPELSLFSMALKLARCTPHQAVMLGDQLTTDVLGANRAGIPSALVGTGITRLPLPLNLPQELTPTYVLPAILSHASSL